MLGLLLADTNQPQWESWTGHQDWWVWWAGQPLPRMMLRAQKLQLVGVTLYNNNIHASAVHLRMTWSLASSVVTLLACLMNQLWCEFSAMYSYKSCTAVVHWHSEQQRRFEDPHKNTFHSNPSAPKKYNLLKTISFSLMLRDVTCILSGDASVSGGKLKCPLLSFAIIASLSNTITSPESSNPWDRQLCTVVLNGG